MNVAARVERPVSEIVLCRSKARAKDWNAFSGFCGASYRCLFHAPLILFGRTLFFADIERFEIFDARGGSNEKIGQCSLVKAGGRLHFADQLQLAPAHRHRWLDVMSRLLAGLGPGQYVYGSEWTLEASRESDFRDLASVTIESVEHAYLETIEFSAWSRWEDYLRDVSRNITRNSKKFALAYGASRFQTCERASGARYLPAVLAMKANLLLEKSVIRSKLVCRAKSFTRILCLMSSLRLHVVAVADRLAGFALCVDVGENAFYLEGASEKEFVGAGWFVLLGAIRDAYERSQGLGLFVMGPVRAETLDQTHWIGLQRSREQCRIVRRPVSTVHFRYGGEP